MEVGMRFLKDRVSVGFDRTAWAGFGLYYHTSTIWLDAFGVFLNVYVGRDSQAKGERA